MARPTMRRGVMVFALVGAAAGVVIAGPWVSEAVAGAELFRVKHVELEGVRYLDRAELLALAAVPSDLSIWADLDPVAERVRAHPLVHEGRVRRRPPATLVLEITERQPVALVPVPVLAPVDREGTILPIDPALHRLDLPLLHPRPEGSRPGVGDEGSTLTPAQLRTLSEEVVRVGALEPRMAASLSDVAIDAWGDVILHLDAPAVAIHYRPPLAPHRLREGLKVLSDALVRAPDRAPRAVDLRFADQVVVRYSHPNGR